MLLKKFEKKKQTNKQGSRDNMSLIIVSFPGAPKEDQSEIEKEKVCNERIEKRVKGI